MFYFIQCSPPPPYSHAFLSSETRFPSAFFQTLCFSLSPTAHTLALAPPLPESSVPVTTRQTLCHPVPGQSSFCYFIQLFHEKGESFYYLAARLQCLADNKPMKATFEPRGPFEKSFFANLSLAHSLFPSLSPSAAFLVPTFLPCPCFASTLAPHFFRYGFSSTAAEISHHFLRRFFFLSLPALRLSTAMLALEVLLARSVLRSRTLESELPFALFGGNVLRRRQERPPLLGVNNSRNNWEFAFDSRAACTVSANKAATRRMERREEAPLR